MSTGGWAREEVGTAGEAVGVAGVARVITVVGMATVTGLIASPVSLA